MAGLFTHLLFKMLPKANGMVNYSDLLIMYDNLDTPLAQTYTPEIKAFLRLLPMKVKVAVAMLCVEGEVTLQCNLKDLSIKKNGLAVIPPGSVAEKLELKDDSKVVVIVVPDQRLAPPSDFHNNTYARGNFTSAVSITLEDSEAKSGIEAYKMLKSLLEGDKDKINADLVKAYMTVLAGIAAIGFQRNLLSHKKNKTSNREQIYTDFLLKLSEDYRQHRDVSYYAAAAGLSPKYFASVIYDASGHHPLELIREQVISDACALLKKGVSIAEVCSILNFTSQSQFTTYFKGATGMTPSAYNKKA